MPNPKQRDADKRAGPPTPPPERRQPARAPDTPEDFDPQVGPEAGRGRLADIPDDLNE